MNNCTVWFCSPTFSTYMRKSLFIIDMKRRCCQLYNKLRFLCPYMKCGRMLYIIYNFCWFKRILYIRAHLSHFRVQIFIRASDPHVFLFHIDLKARTQMKLFGKWWNDENKEKVQKKLFLLFYSLQQVFPFLFIYQPFCLLLCYVPRFFFYLENEILKGSALKHVVFFLVIYFLLRIINFFNENNKKSFIKFQE